MKYIVPLYMCIITPALSMKPQEYKPTGITIAIYSTFLGTQNSSFSISPNSNPYRITGTGINEGNYQSWHVSICSLLQSLNTTNIEKSLNITQLQLTAENTFKESAEGLLWARNQMLQEQQWYDKKKFLIPSTILLSCGATLALQKVFAWYTGK
jgi:hypothetical protein